MSNISKEIGDRIRFFRKKRGLSLQELANLISKSKATVSKYESGAITIDVDTLYDIAAKLHVYVEQLLYIPMEMPGNDISDFNMPLFFNGISRLYLYTFAGRDNSLLPGVIDIHTQIEANIYKSMLYLGFQDYKAYRNCENTYAGIVTHYNMLSRFDLYNQDSSAEHAVLYVMNAFADAESKWAMFASVCSRPIMPCASRVLLSKTQVQDEKELVKSLKISKEDVRTMKQFNAFVVIK